jgi:hypothetical protein
VHRQCELNSCFWRVLFATIPALAACAAESAQLKAAARLTAERLMIEVLAGIE